MDLTALEAALNPKEVIYLEQALSRPINSIQGDKDIELTVDEIAQALIEAKTKKRALLKYQENLKLRQIQAEEMMKPFTAEKLVEYCHIFYKRRFDEDFLIDGRNMFLVKELSKYFTNDPDFNRVNYSLSKGIMIQGNVGTGKTSLMAFFQKNKKGCYTIKSCNDIAEEYLIYKDELEKIYSVPIEKPLHDPSVFYQKYIGYCFDDLGTEEIKNAFGNRKNVMADLLLSIYNKKEFYRFHVTTNMNDDDINEKYGSRISSRINEMFNVFVLEGKDRRQ